MLPQTFRPDFKLKNEWPGRLTAPLGLGMRCAFGDLFTPHPPHPPTDRAVQNVPKLSAAIKKSNVLLRILCERFYCKFEYLNEN